MMLGARTAAWAKSGAPLPYDSEVEWITGTNIVSYGGPHIYSGIKCGDNVGIDYTLERIIDTSTDVVACGVRYDRGDTRFFIDGYSGVWKIGWNNGWNFKLDFNVKCNFRLNFKNDRKATYNDSIVAENIPRLSFVGKDFCLIGYNGVDPLVQSNGAAYYRYYNAKISVGDIVVIDAIPVRFTNENDVSEGAMYDRVSGQLFRNAGTGAFIIGPDKTT